MNRIHSNPRRYRSSAWESVRGSSDSRSDDFARHLREIIRPLQIAYQRLMAAYDSHPVGIECRMDARESWAFALPDASGVKSWRVQQFDLEGFVGHLCFDSLNEAVEDMLRMGYCVPDPGALDRIGLTARWARGVRRAGIMQKHQEGLITYCQMIDEISSAR